MNLDKDVLEVLRAFHERRIKELTVYVEGFGGFFLGRVKDGFVTGYMDKNKRFGIDDHVTVFYGKNGLEGLHRKVSDMETEAYVTPGASYISSPDGSTKLLQDMQGRKDLKIRAKMLFALVYKALGSAYGRGEFMAKRAVWLSESEARSKGLKSPCIYIRPSFPERMLLITSGKNIALQRYLTNLAFGERTTKAFFEHNLPGSKVTKRPRKT